MQIYVPLQHILRQNPKYIKTVVQTAITTAILSIIIRPIWAGFACLQNPCAHGICIDDINSPYQCYCRNGFTGYSCEINWDECRLSPCLNGGSCIDGIASYNCSCPENFAGALCELDLSACDELFPCQNNGTCSYNPTSTNGTGFMCSCLPGFSGNQCEDDISICNTTANICHNGGKCIDSIGDKFYCECASGWSGITCQIDVNECDSQPCQNGGLCINKVNDFGCACPFGYTGRACETKMKICEENPCQNGAFCLEEDDKKTCYCVPDYHGVLCEQRYDECDPFPKCFNGGTCLDGVGGFTCSCPPDFFGPTCQCTEANNATEPECRENGTILPQIPESFSYAIPFPTTTFLFPPFISLSSTILPSSIPDLSSMSTISIPVLSSDGVYDSALDSPYDPGGEKTSIYSPFHSFTISQSPLQSDIESEVFSSQTSIILLPTETVMVSTTYSYSSFGPMTLIPPYPDESETTYEPCPSLEVDASTNDMLPSSLSLFLPQTDEFPIKTSSFSTLSIHSDSYSSYPKISSQIFSDILNGSEILFPSETVDVPSDLYTPSIITRTVSKPLFPPALDSSELISLLSTLTLIPFSGDLTPSISDAVMDDWSLSVDYTPSPQTQTPIVLLSTMDLSGIITSTITTTKIIDIEESPTFESESASLDTSQIPSSLYSVELSHTTIIQIPSVSPTTISTLIILLPPDVESSYVVVDSIAPNVSVPTPTMSTKSDIFTTTITSFDGSLLLTPTVVYPSPSQEVSEEIVNASHPTDDVAIPPSVSTDTGPITSSLPPFEESTVTTTPSISISTMIFSEFVPTKTLIGPSGIVLSPSVEISSVMPTSTLLLSTPEPTMIITTPFSNLSDPCYNYCQNNAKCRSDSIEPICICPFKFVGERCEIARKKFEKASFAGDSFLAYQLPSESVTVVNITAQMATVVSEGILLYTAIRKTYALIFLQSGLVSLHFSCGSQSMHFVEMRTRVDNGFNFTLQFQMGMVIHGANEFRCIGEVSVNESYIMKGEQVLGRTDHNGHPIETVYLGGVGLAAPDAQANDELIAILPGFRGCMYGLMINQENQDMFDDAIDGKDVSECSAFGCVVNPCSSSSKCVPTNKYPFWECICPPGFQGVRCQMRVCSSNPCLNGATCTVPSSHNHIYKNSSRVELSTLTTPTSSQSTSTTPICLCPLGFTGLVCQSQINITKPSFYPTFDYDYSAFISYDPIPRFADWLQLKFHFVTDNMTQIAILLYAGNNQAHSAIISAQLENPLSPDEETEFDPTRQEPTQNSDFFALTFLQGFVALTWNLGSGTQRITTPSRIDNRLNIHTLFAGRSGRHAWLKVDGMRNTTGKTPGPLYRLNVDSDLYVGGYEAFRFEGLPHDLPLHKGFKGCIFDLGFRVKNMFYLPRPLKGRNVKNCYEEDC